MPHIHENTRARRQALQMLYENEIAAGIDDVAEQSFEARFVASECPRGVDENDLVGEKIHPYAIRLAQGVSEVMETLDSQISAVAQNWTLDRMPLVDRNIIRIAAYEVGYCDEIPASVAINEAVEVAKAFGGDDSPKFVNGVLGRIASLYEDLPEAGQHPAGLEDAPASAAATDAPAEVAAAADAPVLAESCAQVAAGTQQEQACAEAPTGWRSATAGGLGRSS